jgi:hypothetical protein
MKVIERAGWAVVFVVCGIYLILQNQGARGLSTGELWGLTTRGWLVTAVSLAVGHHLYVWLCWRSQLYYSLITRLLGRRGFVIYAVGFFILFVTRIVSVFALGYADRTTLDVSPWLLNGIALVITPFILYTFYSVRKYFGFQRAAGIDHFDATYARKPFVRQGMFKYTSNAMYAYGLMLLVIPGLVFASQAALVVGIFNYLYGWVHYHTLEVPDMKTIYS